MSSSKLALLLLAFQPLFAQELGSLSGTVPGVTGEPESAASVVVGTDTQNVSAQNSRYTLVTDSHGGFAITVPVGLYHVLITGPLYGTRTATVRVRANANTAIMFSPTEITQFAAGQSQLPANGRTLIDVLREQASVSGATGTNLYSAGLRSQENHFMLDGLDIDEPWTRQPMLMPSSETAQSANLVQGFVPAEFGHAAGGAILLQTKAGSSIFHGSVFEDFRNSALASRNYFDGDGKAPSTGNRFGATFSGPVQKYDWFFFTSAEGNRSKQGLTVISTVPTSAQKAGTFGKTALYDPLTIASIGENIFARQPFTGNQILLARIPSAVQKLLVFYPEPNLPGAANNFRSQPPSILNSGRFDLRSDKRLSQTNSLFARLAYHAMGAQSPGSLTNQNGNDPFQGASNATTNTKAWAGVIVDRHEFKPTLFNQLRIGAADFDFNSEPLATLPTIDITGYASLGSITSAPSRVRTANYQVEDHITWVRRSHAWRFGFQAMERRAQGTASDVTSRGRYLFTPDYTSFPGPNVLNGATGDAFASFLLGFPEEVQRDVQFAAYHLGEWEWSGFAQDQFRWKRLTVQAGLRYSLLPPVTEVDHHLVNFNFSNASPALNQFAGQGGVNNFAGLDLNRRAFAPRIGFAFLIKDATVLRGGFSKNFDTGTFLTMGRLARNAPYASQLDIVNGTFQLGANMSAGLLPPVATSLVTTAALNASGQAVNAIEPQKFTPYADQWDLFLQHRLRNLMLEIGGVGSMGIHLYAAWDANQPFPAPTPYATPRYPFGHYHGRVKYLNLGGGSTYYGGQLKLSGEVVNGLAVQFSYALAKSLDDATQPGTISPSRPAGPQFIYNARGNRSPSTYDVTHRTVVSANYRIPRSERMKTLIANWNVSALITLQSGFPFTPELATNSLNDGGFQLPNRLGQGSIASPSPAQWFDSGLTGAFRVPALYQYGNSGFGILRGPGLATADASLARAFRFSEKIHLDARIEADNLLNRANFALPNRILGTAASGTINHTATPGRRLQLSLLLNF